MILPTGGHRRLPTDGHSTAGSDRCPGVRDHLRTALLGRCGYVQIAGSELVLDGGSPRSVLDADARSVLLGSLELRSFRSTVDAVVSALSHNLSAGSECGSRPRVARSGRRSQNILILTAVPPATKARVDRSAPAHSAVDQPTSQLAQEVGGDVSARQGAAAVVVPRCPDRPLGLSRWRLWQLT